MVNPIKLQMIILLYFLYGYYISFINNLYLWCTFEFGGTKKYKKVQNW